MTPGLAERHPLKEKRRANKPLLERKRRARINDSLTDLKTLVLSSLNKDVSKYTKMEKVDILDMTVQFLKGNCFEKPVDEQLSIYRAGYAECTQQIYRSIMSMDGLDHSNKYKILSKISERLHPDDRHLSPPPSPNAFFQKSSFPNHLRPPPPPAPTPHAHAHGTPTTRQYSDVSGVPPIAANNTKCANNLYKGHHILNNEQCISPFSNAYDVTPEQIDNLMARNSKLYSSEQIDNLVTRNSKSFSSEQIDDIIARNAKLYSKVQVDDVIMRNEKLYSSEKVEDIPTRDSKVFANELIDKELLTRRMKVYANYADASHLHSEEQGIMGREKSVVWRPW